MHRTTTLDCTTDAPAQARAFTGATATAWGHATDTAEALKLIASELVTNAVQATGDGQQITVSLESPHPGAPVVIAVEDTAPGVPAYTPADLLDPMTEHGRGLQLVEVMSADCGYMPTRAGKMVWALVSPDGRPSPESGRPGPHVLQRVLKGLMALSA